jgi:hypothetical protein
MRELHAEPFHPHRVTDPTARPYDKAGLAPDADGRFDRPAHWAEVLDWRDRVDLTETRPMPVTVTRHPSLLALLLEIQGNVF